MELFIALDLGNFDHAIELIKKGVGLDSRWGSQAEGLHNTILHGALSRKAPYKVVEALFEAGFKDVNVLNGKKVHALQYCGFKHLDVYELCLRHGAHVDHVAPQECTALYMAMITYTMWSESHPEDVDGIARRIRWIQLLLRYGADPYHFLCRPIEWEIRDRPHEERLKWRETCADPMVQLMEGSAHLIKICAAIQCKGGEQSVLRMLPIELIYLLATFMRN